MNDTTDCPRCGAPFPGAAAGGVCPACRIAAALETPAAPPAGPPGLPDLNGTLSTPQDTPPPEASGTDPRLARSLRDTPDDRYQRAVEVKEDVIRIATRRGWRRPVAAGLVVAAAVGVGIAIGRPGRPAPAGPAADPAPDPARLPLPPSPAAPPTPTEVLTSPDWEWTPPENLGPGVNTAHNEQSPCLSANGLTLLFASNRPGGRGATDLWACRRNSPDAAFGGAVNLGPAVNTSGAEDTPSLTADGLTLAFAGPRGGKAGSGVWLARRPTPDAGWAEPAPPGPGINTPAGESRPWLSADGLTLTFARRAADGDQIRVTTRPAADAPFGPPHPFGVGTDKLAVSGPSFSADGRTLLVNRSDRAFPGHHLWLARVDDPARPFAGLVSFGPVVNGPHADTHPAPSADGRVVVFASTRPGGQGGDDLWLTRRVTRRR
ncbi:MAG TPA: hypothetical protein VH092_26800 [Urbifossiella sp.]|jgi:hypothetical protein|nr:hypothetical protein [Urbifossiella sp.]